MFEAHDPSFLDQSRGAAEQRLSQIVLECERPRLRRTPPTAEIEAMKAKLGLGVSIWRMCPESRFLESQTTQKTSVTTAAMED